jgi:membrane glycosyltransferase
MRMRQSIAQFEADFREEAADSVVRREKLRSNAVHRSRARRVDRVHKAGTARFFALCMAILATTVVVTLVMFQVLARVAG